MFASSSFSLTLPHTILGAGRQVRLHVPPGWDLVFHTASLAIYHPLLNQNVNNTCRDVCSCAKKKHALLSAVWAGTCNFSAVQCLAPGPVAWGLCRHNHKPPGLGRIRSTVFVWISWGDFYAVLKSLEDVAPFRITECFSAPNQWHNTKLLPILLQSCEIWVVLVFVSWSSCSWHEAVHVSVWFHVNQCSTYVKKT